MGCSSSKLAERNRGPKLLESPEPTKVEAAEAFEEDAAAKKAVEAAAEAAVAGGGGEAGAMLSTVDDDHLPARKVTINRCEALENEIYTLGSHLHPGSELEIHYEVVRNAVWDPFHNGFIDGSYAKLMWRRGAGEGALFALYRSARATTYCAPTSQAPSGTGFSATERATLLRVLLDEVTEAVRARHGKQWRNALLDEMRGMEEGMRVRMRMRAPPPYMDEGERMG